MRLILTAVCAAAVFVTVLAVPAAALTDPSVYTGTLAGKGIGKAKGLPRQKQTVNVPNTLLTLHPGTSRFDFQVGADSIGGPMKPAGKRAFKILQPTGADLTALLAGTQGFFANNLSLPVNVTDVKVSGRHTPSADGTTDKSNITLKVTGTALGVIPFHATAKLHYAGQ